jgi:hypothetical protein
MIKKIFIFIFLISTISFANEKILISVTTDDTPAAKKDTIFVIDPDGTNKKEIFDFNWNQFDNNGIIIDLFLDKSGKKIFSVQTTVICGPL